jgi:hypothetical protein
MAVYTATATIGTLMTSIYAGCAMQVTYPAGGNVSIAIIDAQTEIVQVYALSDPVSGVVSLYRGRGSNTIVPASDVLLAQSLPNRVNVFEWNFVEIGCVLSATVGYLEFRVNGLTAVSISGINTIAPYANNTASIIGFGAAAPWYIDDFYCNDGTTSDPGTYPNNSFMGNCRVVTLFPTQNASVQWTPLTGANWQEVSETEFDGDTSYNTTTTVGYTDTFNANSLISSAAEVISVWVMGGYKMTDAGARTVEQEVVMSGTTATGSAHNLNTNYNFFADKFAVNPATSASWTTTDVNNITFGYKLAS